jgi:hypothetical protein
VWIDKVAASSRTSVKDDRNTVVPLPADDALHEGMVDLTHEIGGPLREGAKRAVPKPKDAFRTVRFVSQLLAYLLSDRQGPLRTGCQIYPTFIDATSAE